MKYMVALHQYGLMEYEGREFIEEIYHVEADSDEEAKDKWYEEHQRNYPESDHHLWNPEQKTLWGFPVIIIK